MKVRLMYGPGSGQTVEVAEDAHTYRWPIVPRAVAFREWQPSDTLDNTGPEVVEYEPRVMSGRIWYPKRIEEWYVGEQWDGFRPDGAPSPADIR